MTTVTQEEIATVLTEARAKKAALVAEFEAAKAAFVAVSSMANFKVYCVTHADLLRHSTRLILLEEWAEGLRLEVAA